MKTSTKTVIFLVVAFIVVIIITFAARTATAPVVNTNATSTPVAAATPAATSYTFAQISQHSTKADCWTAVNGNVYNLTSFIPSHPGGDKILVVCGKDGTAAFTGQHGGQARPEAELATLKIGVLAK